MSEVRWMRERVELMRAMRASPSAMKPQECDYTPPLELIGIYIARATITRMVAQGDLDVAAGTYLNAALGCHTFCVLHHCTHESISQHAPDHAALENMVFRLACMMLSFDDGYKEAHRAHHARANEPDDPDLILSHTSLPVLGDFLFQLTGQSDGVPAYAHLGLPAGPNIDRTATILHHLGLSGLVNNRWVQKALGLVNWDNVVSKMACNKALKVFKTHKEYESLNRALRATLHSSNTLSYIILSLFFARYPHRNGIALKSDEDSYYDNSFRAQGEVDLWMMGEGPHHMHHAKSDVSYTLLPKICAEVEEAYPHIKVASRGNFDVRGSEYTSTIPARLVESSEPSLQFPWERTQAIRESKEMLSSSPQAAVEQITQAVLDSALHCCTSADRAFLRQVFKDMKPEQKRQNGDHPIPFATWHDTVLSDRTSDLLLAETTRLKAEVANVACKVGAMIPKIESEAGIKAHYLDFFVALADAMVTSEQQRRFMHQLSKEFPSAPKDVDRESLLTRLRSFLESPVPEDFGRKSASQIRARNLTTNYFKTRRRVSDILFGPRSSL